MVAVAVGLVVVVVIVVGPIAVVGVVDAAVKAACAKVGIPPTSRRPPQEQSSSNAERMKRREKKKEEEKKVPTINILVFVFFLRIPAQSSVMSSFLMLVGMNESNTVTRFDKRHRICLVGFVIFLGSRICCFFLDALLHTRQ